MKAATIWKKENRMKKQSICTWILLAICLMIVPIAGMAADPACRNKTTNAEYASLSQAVYEAADGDTIIVLRNCKESSAIPLSKSIRIEGATGNEIVFRDTSTNVHSMFNIISSSSSQITVSFRGIILDGGADWSLQGTDAASARTRTDDNPPAQEALITVKGNVCLHLEEGTVVQNCNTNRAQSLPYIYTAGGIYCEGGAGLEVSLDKAMIKNCSAGGNVYSEAGGISCINYNENSRITFTMNESAIMGCAALNNDDNTGGGMFLASCDSTITNSVIIGNYTFNFGGGFTQRGGINRVTDTRISGNEAGESGGGFSMYTSADCTLDGSTVVSDNVAFQGGAIDITSNKNAPLTTSSKLKLDDDVKIIRNKAANAGGGIMFFNCSGCTVGENVEITQNEAEFGGGFVATAYEGLKYIDLKGALYQNKATKAGADLYAQAVIAEKITLPVANAMDKVYLDTEGAPFRITAWYFDNNDSRFDPVANVTPEYLGDAMGNTLALVAAGRYEYVLHVSYDKNAADATGEQNDDTRYLIGDSVTVKGEGSLHREGYTFVGWNTASDGKGTAYCEGDSFALMEDTVLYAQWGVNPKTGDDSRILQWIALLGISGTIWTVVTHERKKGKDCVS